MSSLPLTEWFDPTDVSKNSEISKARYKNFNLPLLQFMYHGDHLTPLHCVICNQAGWVDSLDLKTGQKRKRFAIDFNHIRQWQSGHCQAGISTDSTRMPSGIFREKNLWKDFEHLLEFMTIMPVCIMCHKWISQDSAKCHITLKNFPHQFWPWFLQNEDNFDRFSTFMCLPKSMYPALIKHLCCDDQVDVHTRLKKFLNPKKWIGNHESRRELFDLVMTAIHEEKTSNNQNSGH